MRKLYKAFFLFSLFLIVIEGRGQSTTETIVGWYNNEEFIANNAVLPSDYLTEFWLFPDSSVKKVDKTGNITPFTGYAVGQIFDVQHENWNAVAVPLQYNIPSISPTRCSFAVDSLRLNYTYIRGIIDSTIIDTLFLYYYQNFIDTQILQTKYFFSSNNAMAIAFPKGFNHNTKTGENFHSVDTILLTTKDTSSRYGVKNIRKRLNGTYFQGGRPIIGVSTSKILFGYTVNFKPGYNYVSGDTVGVSANDKNKANLFGVYTTKVKLPTSLYTVNYSENSVLLSYENAYGGSYNNIKGYVPWVVYPTAQYLHCGVYIGGACRPISVLEINKSKKAQITTLYPSPAKKNEVLTLTLHSKETANYTVLIKNMLGQTVYTTNTFCNGDSETNLELAIPSGLLLGVYYVLLTETSTQTTVDVKKILLTQ